MGRKYEHICQKVNKIDLKTFAKITKSFNPQNDTRLTDLI